MSKAMCTYCISAMLIATSTYKLFTTYQNFAEVKSRLSQNVEVYNQKTQWITWNKPQDHQKYCKAWLFHKFPASAIHCTRENTDQNIVICEFEIRHMNKDDHIQVNVDADDSASKADHNANVNHAQHDIHDLRAPFGFIKIIEHDQHRTIIHWYMNDMINDNLLCMPTGIEIRLGSIINSTSHWRVNINNDWLCIDHLPFQHTISNLYTIYIDAIHANAIQFHIIKIDSEREDYSVTYKKPAILDFI